MTWRCETAYLTCLERLDWDVHRLEAREKEWATAKQRTRVRQDKQSRVERAFTFVYVAGALEDLFKTLDDELVTDLRAVHLKRQELRPSALSLLMPRAWDELNGDRVVRLTRRRDLVQAANNFYSDPEPIDFAHVTQLGLNDGRTVNVHHFEALWDGLCLSPSGASVWVTAAHRQAVYSVATKRNLIAHFEADPRIEAFRYSYGDLVLLVARIRETVERLRESTLLWLDRRLPDG